MLITLLVAALLAGVSGEEEGGWRVVGRLLEECGTEGGCLAAKGVAFFDRAARAEAIPLGDQVTLVRSGDVPRGARALSDEEIDQARSQGRITDLLWDRMASFISTHTIKVDLPKVSSQDLQRGMEEGRGKMKKMMSLFVMAGVMKLVALVPLILGALFLLAGKAFLVSKLALVLTLLIILKKLILAKQEHISYAHPGGHGGGWDRRSLPEGAQEMAYSAHIPS